MQGDTPQWMSCETPPRPTIPAPDDSLKVVRAYEGRFVCVPCQIELHPIQLGVFACRSCDRAGPIGHDATHDFVALIYAPDSRDRPLPEIVRLSHRCGPAAID